MFRTYTLDCHAANPQMPLEPVCPYTGSAATFVLVNLPRPHGKQRIDSVTLSITNADAAVSAHPATREGSSWIVTVPASAIGPAGNVRESIIISASGVDEQNRPVPSWIIGVADLRVRHQDGTAVPGEPRVLISWFESRPANPRGVFICPAQPPETGLDIYNGRSYIPLVTGGVTLEDEVTRASSNGVKSSGIWSAIWGTLAALPTGFSSLYDWCVAKFAALQDVKRDYDDLSYNHGIGPGHGTFNVTEGGTSREDLVWKGYSPTSDEWFPRTPEFSIDCAVKPVAWPRVAFYSPLDQSVEHEFNALDGDEFDITFHPVEGVKVTWHIKVDPYVPDSVDNLATESGVAAAIAAHHDSTKQDKITASGVLKGDGQGGVSAASPSSTGGANADYRDPQDNSCHKTEFGEWICSPAGDGSGNTYSISYSQDDGVYNLNLLPAYPFLDSILSERDDKVVLDFHGVVTATRSAVCTNGKKFVTEDVAAKQSDIPALAAPSDTATDAQAAKARATYDFVNSSINAMAAFYITKNAAGDSFATKAELTAAIASGTFYNGGQPRTPTKNDYLYILADESHPTAAGTSPTTRYSFDGTQWSFQIVVNDTALTAAQLAAMNSGINAALVTWLTTFKGTDTATTLASIIEKLAHLESDGTADDDFATDLLGKPVANIKANTVSLAAAYSETATYAVGDAVTHDGKLYKCAVAITTAEAWTPAHWTETTVATLWNNADTTSYGGQN